MVNFDSRLLALAGCSVIPHYSAKPKKGKKKEKDDLMGGIIFDPYPSITASNDLVLSHEVCHRIAGKKDYDIFLTAVLADGTPLFKFILNLLYDWYHEIRYEVYSPFLKSKVRQLHERAKKIKIPKAIKEVDELNYLIMMYEDRLETPEEVGVRDCHDLVYLARETTDQIRKTKSKKQMAALNAALKDWGNALAGAEITGAGASSYGEIPKRSNFYVKTTARYGATIDALSEMWLKNKYDWLHKHYGEIDWKNLVKVFMGEKLEWPVFVIIAKIILAKNIHLVIDRSGSTNESYKGGEPLKNLIMELAVIIAESLRRCEVPISVADVGVEDKVINRIDQPIDIHWFTPMANGGTPLGEVCLGIKEKDPESLLLIITDGEPWDFDKLHVALKRFPGENLTFVIGSAYRAYSAQIRNAIPVEPQTILKELQHFIDKGGEL